MLYANHVCLYLKTQLGVLNFENLQGSKYIYMKKNHLCYIPIDFAYNYVLRTCSKYSQTPFFVKVKHIVLPFC